MVVVIVIIIVMVIIVVIVIVTVIVIVIVIVISCVCLCHHLVCVCLVVRRFHTADGQSTLESLVKTYSKITQPLHMQIAGVDQSLVDAWNLAVQHTYKPLLKLGGGETEDLAAYARRINFRSSEIASFGSELWATAETSSEMKMKAHNCSCTKAPALIPTRALRYTPFLLQH